MMDAETQLLACLILEPDSIVETALLEPEDFLDKAFGEIFGRLKEVYNSGLKCSCYELPDRFSDLPSLQGFTHDEIKKFFFNMARMIIIQFMDVPSLVRSLRYAGLKRKLSVTLQMGDSDIKRKELEPLIQEIQDKLSEMSLAPEELRNSDIRQVGYEILEDMQTTPKVYPTGLDMLDEVMAGGLYGGKCYGFAARKKSGKTAFMITVAQNLNRRGVKSVYVALEMGRKEIMHRIISRGINSKPINFINHRKNDPQFRAQVAQFVDDNPKNLFFMDKAGIGFEELKRELLLIQRKEQPQVIILDYWQLVGGKDGKQSTAEHLDNVAQWLATFAKTHNVAVMAASQINQEGNTRGSEGMRLAFDQIFQIHRLPDEGEPKLWMEMMDTRYTVWQNVGDEATPRFTINPNGVYFEEKYYAQA